jgi:hypothetical protein
MEDKQKVLEQNWRAADARLWRCREAHFFASQTLEKALSSRDQQSAAEASRSQLAAAEALKRAQLAEAEARYLCGEDVPRDTLRWSVQLAAGNYCPFPK